MGYENILVEIEAPIATLTLNRPKVLNALSPDLIRELTSALADLDADESVRAVVLTGGKYAAMEVMLSGAPITAERAYELGIVNKVVPAEMTIEVARRLARQLAEKPPLAIRMAKEAVLKAFEGPLAEGLASERKSFYFLFASEDQKEGMHAFLEKRKGVFRGQ